MSGVLIYLAFTLITATLINGYMKKQRRGDPVDQLFFSAIGGLFWFFTLAFVMIHFGGEMVQHFMEENYD